MLQLFVYKKSKPQKQCLQLDLKELITVILAELIVLSLAFHQYSPPEENLYLSHQMFFNSQGV